MQSNRSVLKNMIWAVCIAVSLVALLVGIICAAAGKYDGEQQDGTLYLDSRPSEKKTGGISAADDADELSETVSAAGEPRTLPESEDGGQSYIDNLTFLCDSSLIGLREYGMLSGGAATNQVWGSSAGNIPASEIASCIIKSPADGTEIPAAQAASNFKPPVLVMSLGMDSLSSVTREDFISYYTSLINDIRDMSPDTIMIVCCPTSVIADYDGADDLSIEKVAALKDWIIDVCRNTGVYYADFWREICDSTGALGTNYASANGKTLNSTGLNLVLNYLRTHMP